MRVPQWSTLILLELNKKAIFSQSHLYPLFRSSVLPLFLVLEHAQIGLIARGGKFTAFKCGKHCATWFVGVGAVAILAILR